MSWFNYWLVLNLCKNGIFFNGKQIQCVAFLDFFAKAQEARELIKNRELNLYLSRHHLSHRTKIIILGEHSEVTARVLNKNVVS